MNSFRDRSRSAGVLRIVALFALVAPAGAVTSEPVARGVRSFASTPVSLTDVKGTLFFVADDGTSGAELWKSDGTAAGTVLVKDISPGASGSSPASLLDHGGTLVFTADDGAHGRELWKSDGTASGTVQVKDVLPGAGGSAPSSLVRRRGVVYFAADDGVHGRELWKSDGSDAGTVLVKDVLPGATGSSPDSLVDLPIVWSVVDGFERIDYGGALAFVADDGVSGRELWRSDGTETATMLVADVRPGPEGSSVTELIEHAGAALYFVADDGVHGSELWRSEGTATFTGLVRDIVHGPGSSSPSSLTVAGSLYFVVDETDGAELWRVAGDAGAVSVMDIRPGNEGSNPQSLAAVNGLVPGLGESLYFGADDGRNGSELWRTYGTTATTARIAEIAEEYRSRTPLSCDPHEITALGPQGLAVFAADDREAGHGTEFWFTDGTERGTRIAADLVPGAGSSDPSQFTKSGTQLFFTAADPAGGVGIYVADLAYLVGGTWLSDRDADGDGFPAEVEFAFGSAPGDPASTPQGLGVVGPAANSILSRVDVRLSFRTGEADTASIAGVVRSPKDFSAAGKRVLVDVGGAIRSFTLDDKGVGQTSDGDRFELRTPTRTGRTGATDVARRWSAKFAPSDLARPLGLQELVGRKIAVQPFVYVFVEGLGVVFQGSPLAQYSVRKGRSGVLRLARRVG